jgi:hypothetical protein
MKAGLPGTKIKKDKMMKKILAFIVLSIVMVSCYEDYILDYTYTGIYFPYQQDVRTFVVGEGMKFEVGAALGGVRKNTIDRNVSFILDNSLITPALLAKMQSAGQNYIKNATAPVTALLPLPANHYTMSNSSQMVIKAGWHMGSVVIRADSAVFCNDSVNTRNSTYILPFYITAADADSILEPKRSNMVGVMFENMLFGNYWHGGAALVNRPSKADTTITYPTTVPTNENNIWTLTTVGPQTLTANGYYNSFTSTTQQMQLVLKGSSVIVSGLPGADVTITSDGASTFNRSKLLQDRRIYLKYQFTDAVTGYTFHCTDTLTYRNRIRDGINEWQDENPEHYTK